MPQHAPGRSHRKGLTIRQLFAMFPDDDTAERWFERQRWPHGPVCPNCGSMRATRTTHPTMSLRCKDCRKFFSVRKGTVMGSTKLGYQTWAIIVYMATTSLKGVSSMKIHRELGVTQKTAWFLKSRAAGGVRRRRPDPVSRGRDGRNLRWREREEQAEGPAHGQPWNAGQDDGDGREAARRQGRRSPPRTKRDAGGLYSFSISLIAFDKDGDRHRGFS